jgi:hypothetical protein
VSEELAIALHRHRRTGGEQLEPKALVVASTTVRLNGQCGGSAITMMPCSEGTRAVRQTRMRRRCRASPELTLSHSRSALPAPAPPASSVVTPAPRMSGS